MSGIVGGNSGRSSGSVETISSDVVDDTSPQLGGNLDLNSNDITGTGGIPAANLTGSVPAAALGNVNLAALEYNQAILAFKVASANQLAKFQMVDQVIDEYQDATGIDASASTNEVAGGATTAKYYEGASAGTGPAGGSSTGNYTHGGLTYYFNKFTADTNLVTDDAGTADVFLIGGGGSSAGDNSGGGGAGGLIWKAGHAFAASTTFAIDIGIGGVGADAGAQDSTTSGADTTLASTTFVAKGGGYGGSASKDGIAGGSGGGAGRNTGSGSDPGASNQSSQSGDSGTYGFGYAGGAGRAASDGPGGGGGGSGAVGLVGTSSGTVGNGGVGKSDFVNSSATETTAFLFALTAGTDGSNAATDGSSTGTLYIGGGGSGGTQDRGTHSAGGLGGFGGGGNIGVAALANTGSGGAGTASSSGDGMNGGSGLAIIRYLASDFQVSENLTLQSVATTAESAPTTADLVVLIEDGAGTASVNTDIKGFISRNGSAFSSEVTFVDEGDWGTNKRILVARNVDISGITSGVAMKYKLTTHNQSTGSKETRIHATSLAWA